MFQFLITSGTGFEVLTVERIHNIVWVRTPYILVRLWLRTFWRIFWVCLHRPSDNGSSMSRPNCLCWPFRLYGPITEKPKISNLNIIHFSCTVSLCYKNFCTHVRKFIALSFYIILWSEQKCVAGNKKKNSKVYSLIRVCSCFVIILKVYIFWSHHA